MSLPSHARVEELRDAGCFEDRRAVVARGDDGGPDVLRAERLHERDRVLIAVDAVPLEMLHEILVLEVAERVHGLQAGTVFRGARRQLD